MRHLDFTDSRGWHHRLNATSIDRDPTRGGEFHGDGTATYYIAVQVAADEDDNVSYEYAADRPPADFNP